MYQEYLFHGSPIGGLTVLKPQISLELKPRLYATADRRYAIIRAGAQLDLVREEYQGFDKPLFSRFVDLSTRLTMQIRRTSSFVTDSASSHWRSTNSMKRLKVSKTNLQ